MSNSARMPHPNIRKNIHLWAIFDQWPKLSLGLDVRPEIPISKVNTGGPISNFQGRRKV